MYYLKEETNWYFWLLKISEGHKNSQTMTNLEKSLNHNELDETFSSSTTSIDASIWLKNLSGE